MEHGFYHPERGYWQTIGGDPVRITNGRMAHGCMSSLRPLLHPTA
jgi:hypothetical protein